MNKENILEIVDKAIDIGRSSEHYVTIDVSANPLAFPVDVYIHNIDSNGLSAGIADRMCFSTIDSIELHEEWISHWTKRLREERISDTN